MCLITKYAVPSIHWSHSLEHQKIQTTAHFVTVVPQWAGDEENPTDKQYGEEIKLKKNSPGTLILITYIIRLYICQNRMAGSWGISCSLCIITKKQMEKSSVSCRTFSLQLLSATTVI